ncbi:MAG: hypothetical protein HGB36_04475 [Chlorobiaceae bacterium]|nr:hypothetical protein [Chlorobiaceae bacterium]
MKIPSCCYKVVYGFCYDKIGAIVADQLGLNELAKLSAGKAVNYGSMAISFVFAFFMLVIAALQLRMIHYE